MARQLRIEYPGAIYHLLSRGDRGQAIFRDDRDRQSFLDVLAEACAKTGWQAHAYCLMKDHFHLVVETPQPNLSAGMKWFLGTYTNRFQHRHNFPKRLFSGRYKSVIIDAGVPGHLRLTCDYVHLNPARAKCLRPKQSLQAFRWSSYPAYLKPPTQRPAWLHVDWLLTEMGIAKDSEAGRRQFASQMEQRRQEAVDSQWKPLRRGWYLGDKKFRRLLLDTARAKLGPIRSGLDPQKAAEEKKARRILREEMARLKWNQAELNRRRKGDAQKMRIAERIRAQSTVTTRWLAENLKMGAVTSVSSRLYHAKAHPTTR